MMRGQIIAIAVAMGTPKAEAEANYDAVYPQQVPPGATDIVGGGADVINGLETRYVIYGDGRREDTEVINAQAAGAGAAGRSVRAVAKKR
jgi:hypothetical protein